MPGFRPPTASPRQSTGNIYGKPMHRPSSAGRTPGNPITRLVGAPVPRHVMRRAYAEGSFGHGDFRESQRYQQQQQQNTSTSSSSSSHNRRTNTSTTSTTSALTRTPPRALRVETICWRAAHTAILAARGPSPACDASRTRRRPPSTHNRPLRDLRNPRLSRRRPLAPSPTHLRPSPSSRRRSTTANRGQAGSRRHQMRRPVHPTQFSLHRLKYGTRIHIFPASNAIADARPFHTHVQIANAFLRTQFAPLTELDSHRHTISPPTAPMPSTKHLQAEAHDHLPNIRPPPHAPDPQIHRLLQRRSTSGDPSVAATINDFFASPTSPPDILQLQRHERSDAIRHAPGLLGLRLWINAHKSCPM